MADEPKVSIADRMRIAYAAAYNVEKNGRNKDQNYDYASVDDVKAAANRAFREAGLFVQTCSMSLVESSPAEKRADGTRIAARAVVAVRLVVQDGDGNDIELSGLGEARDSNDKAFYKAQAGAIKYALMTGLLIATGDRDDPENDAAEPPSKAAPAKSAAPAKTPAEVEAGLRSRITTCKSVDELRALQKPVHAAKDVLTKEQLDGLVAAYKDCMAALTAKKED